MQITLTNFKIWENQTFDLGDYGITLIAGYSGQGKSSIMQAILFALYGTGNKLTTFGKKKTVVKLEIDLNFIITRQNSPKKLTILYHGKEYVDDEAQLYIDKRFSKVFDIVGYIEQKSIHNFISMTPKDRLEFIEKFAFENVDVKNMKLKGKQIAKERLDAYNIKYGSFQAIDKLLQEIDIDDDNKLCQMTSTEIEDEIERVEKQLQNEEKYQQLHSRYEQLQKEIEMIEKTFIGNEVLANYEKMIRDYTKFQDYQAYIAAKTRMKKIQETLWDKKEWQIRQQFINQQKQLKEAENTFQTLKRKQTALNFNKQELKRLKLQVEYNYGTCPKCQTPLQYNQSEIKLVQENLSQKNLGVEERKIKLQQIKKMEQQYLQNKQYLQDMEKLEKKCDFWQNLDNEKCSQYESEIQVQKNRQAEYEMVKRQVLKYAHSTENPPTSEEENVTIDQDYKKMVNLVQEHKTNYKLLQKYKMEMQNIEKEMKDLQKESEEKITKEFLQQLQKAKQYRHHFDKRQILEQELSQMSKACESINTLLKNISITQNLVIENVLNTIQTNAQIYLDKFFEQEMIIKIATFTDKNKPLLNIQLFYKGHDTAIKSLSGGEMDRLILAMTLALANLFQLDLILLDEIIGSLDVDSTHKIIEIVKETANDKLVIFIAHQLVSGQFDKIVQI